jgi:hypothetical protein
MPLPQAANFESLLASFAPEKPSEGSGWEEFIAVPERGAFMEDDRQFVLPAISFWYRAQGNLSMEVLQKRVASELANHGHSSSPEIAAAVLAMFAFAKKSSSSVVQQFNEGLRVTNADLNQFFILPYIAPVEYRFDFGPFTIGAFNPERLAYQSKKAGSDFFERYQKSLRHLSLSFERRFRPIKVVDWRDVAQSTWLPSSASTGEAIPRIVDAYYDELAGLHFQVFFAELEDLQELPTALGSGWFNLLRLQELLRAQRVSVFLNIGPKRSGFVSPTAVLSLTVDLGGGHLGIPFTEQYVRKHFNLENFQTAEIHQSLRAFCHFLAKAVRHDHEGRQGEAFLHYIIALDLLLGDTAKSSATVSSRSAALTYEALNRDYTALLREMKRAYDARSKYVHEGRQPDSALLKTAEAICREVAFCLLRLQRDVSSHQPGFRDQWIRYVDFVVKAVEAARPTTADDLKRAGIATPQDVSYLQYFSELTKPTKANTLSDQS